MSQYPSVLMSQCIGFQPTIGELIMLPLQRHPMRAIYMGLKFVEDKVVHVYYHQTHGELESEEQIAVPLYLALSYYN